MRLQSPTERSGTVHHWPGSSTRHLPRSHDQHKQTVESIRRYHKSTGYADIAYNLVVCPCGHIMQGRGTGVRSGANGTTETNRIYGALLWLLGPDEQPTLLQRQAAVRAAEAIAPRYPNVHRPHSDVRPGGTACPGPAVTAWTRNPTDGGDDVPGTVSTDYLRDQNKAIATLVAKLHERLDGPIYRINRYLDSKNSENLALLRQLLAVEVTEVAAAAGSDLTPDQIADAVELGLRRVLGSLDDQTDGGDGA